MQPTLQPSQPTQSVDPQSDPHDAIVALMRGNSLGAAMVGSVGVELHAGR